MKKTITITLALVAGLFLWACDDFGTDGVDRLEKLYPTPQSDGDSEAADGDSESDGEQIGELTGRVWAAHIKFVANMTPKGFSTPWTATFDDLFLATMSEDGRKLSLRFCEQYGVIDSTLAPKTAVPEAARKGLYDKPIELRLGSGPSVEEQEVFWGWGLSDPENPLPADIKLDNPRLYDQDDDGHEAMTVTILPKDWRYIVRRDAWRLQRAVADEEKKIRGTLHFDMDERPLKASSSLYATAATLTEKDGGKSFYAMKCLAGCDDVNPSCIPGDFRCKNNYMEVCTPDEYWAFYRDCVRDGKICVDGACESVDGDVDGETPAALVVTEDGDADTTENDSASDGEETEARVFTCDDVITLYEQGELN